MGQDCCSKARRHLGINTPALLSFLPVPPSSPNNQNLRARELESVDVSPPGHREEQNGTGGGGWGQWRTINSPLPLRWKFIRWVTMLRETKCQQKHGVLLSVYIYVWGNSKTVSSFMQLTNIFCTNIEDLNFRCHLGKEILVEPI